METIAFYIQGNSMFPTISNGDMVICSQLEQFETVEENELYAIITHTGMVLVKRVQIIKNRNNKVVQLKLISDNKSQYTPIKIPTQNIRSLLKVEQKVTATAHAFVA